MIKEYMNNHIQTKQGTEYITVFSSENKSYAQAIYNRLNANNKRLVGVTDQGTVIYAIGKLVRVK